MSRSNGDPKAPATEDQPFLMLWRAATESRTPRLIPAAGRGFWSGYSSVGLMKGRRQMNIYLVFNVNRSFKWLPDLNYFA